jgi:hypothetical protein
MTPTTTHRPGPGASAVEAPVGGHPGPDGLITVLFSRRVKPGREADVHAWARGVTTAAHHSPATWGRLGAAILVDALRQNSEGGCVIDPTIVSRLVGRRRREDPLSELTEREREVLALLAEGPRTWPSPTGSSSPSARSRPTTNRSSGGWASRQIPPPTGECSPC